MYQVNTVIDSKIGTIIADLWFALRVYPILVNDCISVVSVVLYLVVVHNCNSDGNVSRDEMKSMPNYAVTYRVNLSDMMTTKLSGQ